MARVDESLESRVRAATPQDAAYVHIHDSRVLTVELPDGRLLQMSPEGRIGAGHPIVLPSGGLSLLYSDSP